MAYTTGLPSLPSLASFPFKHAPFPVENQSLRLIWDRLRQATLKNNI